MVKYLQNQNAEMKDALQQIKQHRPDSHDGSDDGQEAPPVPRHGRRATTVPHGRRGRAKHQSRSPARAPSAGAVTNRHARRREAEPTKQRDVLADRARGPPVNLGLKHPGPSPRQRADVEEDKRILMAYYEEYEPSLADEGRIAGIIKKFRQQYGGKWRDNMYKKIGQKRDMDPRDFWRGGDERPQEYDEHEEHEPEPRGGRDSRHRDRDDTYHDGRDQSERDGRHHARGRGYDDGPGHHGQGPRDERSDWDRDGGGEQRAERRPEQPQRSQNSQYNTHGEPLYGHGTDNGTATDGTVLQYGGQTGGERQAQPAQPVHQGQGSANPWAAAAQAPRQGGGGGGAGAGAGVGFTVPGLEGVQYTVSSGAAASGPPPHARAPPQQPQQPQQRPPDAYQQPPQHQQPPQQAPHQPQPQRGHEEKVER